MSDPNCVVLVVEDDLNDRMLLTHAFRRAAPHVDLRLAKDAFQAEDYLCGRGAYEDRSAHPPPLLILLDLKLPRRSGIELLRAMKDRGVGSNVPAIVLSSSQEASDIDRAYELGARSYLVKSVDLSELLRVAEGIGAYAQLLSQASPQTATAT